jgi:hypothetical protein
MRERSNRFYGPLSYLTSKLLFDVVPLRIIPSIILGTVAYFMAGYSINADNYFKFLLVICVFAIECGLFCLCISFGFEAVGTANLVASITLLFKMLLAGFLINQGWLCSIQINFSLIYIIETIPSALKWIQYLSFYKYAYEAIVVNELAQSNIVDNISGIDVTIPASIIMSKFGFNLKAYWNDVFISIGVIFLLLSILIALVIFKLKERR